MVCISLLSRKLLLLSASASVGTSIVAPNSLEQFKLKVSDFCQRITVSKAPTIFLESPIAKIKAQRNPSSSNVIKLVFSQGQVQDLKEIFKQFLDLEFEVLAEGELKVHLQICCQAACYLKITSPDLYKQLFDRASDFQVKANQLSDIQEKHL